MHIRIILESFEKHKCPGTAFFYLAWIPDMFLISSYVYKQLDYMRIFYFYLVSFFYFIFSTPISFSYVFQFPHLLFIFMFFLKPLSSVV